MLLMSAEMIKFDKLAHFGSTVQKEAVQFF